MSEATIIKKTQCPRCASQGKDRSSDNLVEYSDGGKHCFNKDVKVITNQGIKPIFHLLDRKVTILNGKKEWEVVRFKSYGTQRIWNLNITRNSVYKTIKTTYKHEWFVYGSSNCIYTKDLKPDMFLVTDDPNNHLKWRVISVEELNEEQEVYCCETSTQSFYLEDYVLTHNCFACGYTVPSDSYKKTDYNVYEHEDKLAFSTLDYKKLQDIYTNDGLNFRGIDEETYTFFGVLHEIINGKVVKQFYPLVDNTNQICGLKVRTNPKGFYAQGKNKVSETLLFGQAKFSKSLSKTVLICSGELDALSAYQMLKSYGSNCPAIVSSTVGERGFAQYQAQYDFLNRFEKIIVVPDKDKAGKEALEEICKVLPRDKMLVVDLPRKDINDMLTDPQDLQQDFVDRVFRAKPYVPDGVIGSSELYDTMLELMQQTKVPLPPFLPGLNKMLSGGLPLESIVNIVAASGIGEVKYNPEAA